MFAPKVAKPQTKATEGPTSRLVAQRSTLAGHGHGRDPIVQAHFLQTTIGNQAVLPLLRKQASDPDREMENTALSGKRGGLFWDFSKIPVFSLERVGRSQAPFSPPTERFPNIIQAKLEVGAVDDPLEREADRVAEQVMRTPDAVAVGLPTAMGGRAPGVLRKPAGPQVSNLGTSATRSAMTDPPPCKEYSVHQASHWIQQRVLSWNRGLVSISVLCAYTRAVLPGVPLQM